MSVYEPPTCDQLMSHSVRSHLRLEIDAYDDTIRKFIPGYEEGLTRAANEIAAARPTLVLDLGAHPAQAIWNPRAFPPAFVRCSAPRM